MLRKAPGRAVKELPYMNDHQLGQSFALLAAITWAVAVVLFKLCGDRIPPLALNLFKNTVGIVLLSLTLVALPWLPVEPGVPLLRWHNLADICLLAMSGIVGIALADTLFFYALNLIGVGLLSIVDCLYSPLIILFSWLILVEELSWCHYVGGALILTGVFISSRHPPPPDRTRGQLLLGIALAIAALVTMAIGIVVAKPLIAEYNVLWTAEVRLLAGTVFLALATLVLPGGRQLWTVFRPAPVWKVSVPAAVLAAYLAMIFWVAGFKYTQTAVAAILNQTSIFFSLIFATWFLKERFTARKLAAILIAAPGVVLITLSGYFEALVHQLREAMGQLSTL